MGIRGPSESAEITTPIGTVNLDFFGTVEVKKWFTDVTTVRTMFGPEELSNSIINEEQILSGTEENSLRLTNIKVNSEILKVKTENTPPDDITLEDYETAELAHSNLISGTVKVFAYDDESALLTEGEDYSIDYSKGQIVALEPESIELGDASEDSPVTGTFNTSVCAEIEIVKQVYVHYEYYSVLTRDSDYTINYTLGRIARLIGGNIISGQKVYVDYQKEDRIDQQLIELYIDMVHCLIIERIGEQYESSTDKSLKYAESNFTAAAVASAVFSRIINEGLAGSPNIHNITKNLKKIEDSGNALGETFLKKYIDYGGYTAGTLKKNTLFE